MSIKLNQKGVTHAASLIRQGEAQKASPWSSNPNDFSMCFDSFGEIKKFEKTPEGFLRAKVRVSMVGVAEYPGGIKKAKIPDELFSGATLDSLRGIPVTDEHPQEDGKYIFVDNNNFSTLGKGDFSEPEIDGDFIRGTIVIRDLGLVEAVEAGKRTVSLGYWRNDDYSPGQFRGQSYDAIQRNIFGNHLAITDSPRLGESVSIEIDSQGKIKSEGKKMAKKEKWVLEVDGEIASNRETLTLNVGDKDIQVDSVIYAEVQKQKQKAKDKEIENDSLKKEIEDLKKKLSAIETDSKGSAELEAEKAKSKALQTKVDEYDKSFDSKVQDAAKDMIELEKKAELFEVDSKGKNAEQIKREIISKSSLEVDGNNLDKTKVDAFFHAACSLYTKEKAIEKDSTPPIDNDANERAKALKDAGVDIVGH